MVGTLGTHAFRYLAVSLSESSPQPCRYLSFRVGKEARQIVVENVPAFYTDLDVADLFACFGSVQQCSSAEGGVAPRLATIVFEENDAVERAMAFDHRGTCQPFLAGSRAMGMAKWRADYARSVPDAASLMDKVNAFMNAFDAEQVDRLKAKASGPVVDEDGFTKVTNKRGKLKRLLPKMSSGPEVAKKRKGGEVLHGFYARSRAKDAKTAAIAHIRQQFQSDKAKIQEMKTKRNFKP